jgi:hypothetical protein
MAALDGLTVVALEQDIAAPFCTRRLVEAGNRVTKLEREEDDFARANDQVLHGESAYFVWLHASMESLHIDTKDPKDAALLHLILALADVFVQNLAPGAAWVRLSNGAGLSSHGKLRCAEVQTPSGPASLPASPVRRQNTGTALGPVPPLGQYDESIGSEFP